MSQTPIKPIVQVKSLIRRKKGQRVYALIHDDLALARRKEVHETGFNRCL
jgi:hypothetical protein